MKRAFTLVELIIVLALLVLATSAVVPSFVRFHQQEQLGHAARRVISMAGEARGLALSRGAVAALAYDPQARELALVVEPNETEPDPALDGEAPLPAPEPPSPDARLLRFPPEVRLEIENRDGPETLSLRFYPDGRADLGRIAIFREELRPIRLAVNPRTGRMAVVEEQP
ncbi:MAG: prepilin-type N-terminal cleavage/methylation domain-containing protein [Armatimonadota bacterium]